MTLEAVSVRLRAQEVEVRLVCVTRRLTESLQILQIVTPAACHGNHVVHLEGIFRHLLPADGARVLLPQKQLRPGLGRNLQATTRRQSLDGTVTTHGW